jgi:hypothetical protein
MVTNFTNGSGSAMPQGSPISKTGVSNQISLTDPTNETSVRSMVGVAQYRIAASTLGPGLTYGRLEVLTGYSFSIGDAIYVGIGGILQNVKPDYGVTGFAAGDWVVFVGVICQNELNPSDQDLMVMPQIIGQL